MKRFFSITLSPPTLDCCSQGIRKESRLIVENRYRDDLPEVRVALGAHEASQVGPTAPVWRQPHSCVPVPTRDCASRRLGSKRVHILWRRDKQRSSRLHARAPSCPQPSPCAGRPCLHRCKSARACCRCRSTSPATPTASSSRTSRRSRCGRAAQPLITAAPAPPTSCPATPDAPLLPQIDTKQQHNHLPRRSSSSSRTSA